MEAKSTFSTLVDLLQGRAELQPAQAAFSFMSEDGTQQVFTYAELDRRARALAARLQQRQAAGERALLLYPPGLEYITAFFGCLYAGVVPVPAYPPRANGHLGRLQAIVSDSQASLALTTPAILASVEHRFGDSPALSALMWLTAEGTDELGELWQRPQLTSDSLAFLQYTSGSTSLPKGVMLTHGNLLHNLELIQDCFGTSPDSNCVIWLPPYHDMGLIGGILQPLFTGYPVTLMPPVDFIQRPLKWLETISRLGASVSGGPNFAYELCLQKITPEQRDTLDLSSWKIAFTGAEPIRSETLERFAEFFAPCGFKKEAFYPCYGLAEGTLFVTGGHSSEAPIANSFDGQALKENRALAVETAQEGDRTLVSSGRVSLVRQQVVIADPQSGTLCQDGQVGEIWVCGPSVAQGYWQRPEQTEETFCAYLKETGEGPFLRTGDLGFLHDGELYVTGRLKDLIIIRGRNYYPNDIEFAVQESHPAVKNSNGAAVAVEVDGEERLVIVQEIERTHRKSNLAEAAQKIRQAVSEEHQLQVYAVVLIKPVSIPKTSSGKVQRHKCRENFLSDTLDVVYSDVLHADADVEAASAAEMVLDADTAADSTAELNREWLLAADQTERQAALRSFLTAKAARALGVPQSAVHPDRSLNTLGLDSLIAVELKHVVEETFGVPVPFSRLLAGPSLAELAEDISLQLTAGVEPDVTEAETGDVQGPFALSHGQRALWFMQALAPDSAAYNIARAAKILSPLDRAALQAAFAQLEQRHELLRSRFVEQNGEPVGVVREAAGDLLTVTDAASWSDEELRDALAAEANRPFDLAQDAPLRVHLFERGESQSVLLLTAHHIISDFWSLGVLVQELQALYQAAVQGTALPLAKASRSFTHYIREQETMLNSGRRQELESYWRQQLGGDLPVLNLPTDRPRPPVQSYRGAASSFALPPALSAALKKLAAKHGVTLYMTLLAAFQVLLHRISGQEEVLIASPTTGRSSAKDAGVIGYFVNPVVQRADFAQEPAFADFLADVRQTVVGALEHQDYPFPLLVELLQPERDPSYPPLAQAMFTYQKSHLAGLEGMAGFSLGEAGAVLNAGALTLQAVELEQRHAQFDLSLTMAETDGELAGRFEYNSDLFAAETIERISLQFATLLSSITNDCSTSVSALTLLPEQEKALLLHTFNDTATDDPQGLCIHQLVEQQAAATPDAIAVIDGDVRVTYGELNAQANRIAHRLQQLGVGPEALVGIFMERGALMVGGMLAVLKAGGAYVPLDPAYPKERIAYTMEDAQMKAILTQTSLAGELPEHSAHVLSLDALQESLLEEPADNPAALVTEDHLAYVIYTSGSTGQPKGVAIEHKSAAALIHWAQAEYAPDELAGVLFATSICFDLSVYELFVTLSLGGKVIVAENALHLPQLPAKDEVTLINTVPSAIGELLRMEAIPQSVRTVNLAGEALPLLLVQKLYRLPSIENVYNLYGPSEDTTYSTYALIERGALTAPAIGRPLSNTQVYLLDKQQQPVPIGVAGELHLSGRGLARGYLGRDELTAEKFIPNPFSTEPDSRMYATGDLARWLPDGTLEYLGRIDHQVKVRGFRIELGEIESCLTEHAAVQAALVMVREDVPGDQRITAYVAGDRSALDTDGLRRTLKRKLPDYMMPSAFVLLETLPLTPNGKVDRKALPAPAFSSEEGEYAAPRTPLEVQVAAILSDVLSVERVGVHDNFFALGGHSLLATRVMMRIGEAFGVQLPLQALFEAPTTAALALRVTEAQRTCEHPFRAPIEKADRTASLPLSFAQQRLWVLEQLLADKAAYNMPYAVRLHGPLNRTALEQAFTWVVERHETLRTSFAVVEGQPVQVIAAEAAVQVPLTDLSALSAAKRETEMLRLVKEETVRPFDLTDGPLLRLALLKLSTDEHVLLLNMHHIISDGWSLEVLTKAFARAYDAACGGLASPLAELPVQYADYALWQRGWMQGETLAEQLSYWQTQLGGELPVLQLPTDRPRPALQTYRGDVVRFSLGSQVKAGLQAIAHAAGATLHMTMLTAFNALLARYSGQEDICVGTPVAGRGRQETEEMIGFFVNTLVMRTDLSGTPSFTDLLARVKETALRAYAHQDVPFEKLVETLEADRDLSRTPLFQVMFDLQQNPVANLELNGLTLQTVPVETNTSKFDLMLAMTDEEDRLAGAFEYNTDLFDRATIERMTGHLETMLTAVCADPELTVAALPLLTAAERAQLLTWNETTAEYPRDRTIGELFAEQAQNSPEGTALEFEGARLTYRELNERANALAHYLQKQGVQSGERVGLCMERSLELVISLLAIVKAGAAYVPFDANYPQERLLHLFEDSQVNVLLTQSGLAPQLPAGEWNVLCVDREQERIAQEPILDPTSGTSAHNAAYVTYTSGSTGKPKGVVVPHHAVVRLVKGTDYVSFGADEVFLQVASISFDAATFEIWGPLLNGAKLVIFPAHLPSLEELGRVVQTSGVTTLWLTAGLFHQMVDERLHDLTGVRQLLAGGDALQPGHVRKALAELPDTVLINGYGPTESTTFATTHAMTDPAQVGASVPIGRPIKNTTVYVLDAAMELAPVGVPGELYIGGDGLAIGYLGQPELTAERFVPHPFTASQRLYKTGDLVRWLADGTLEFMGRLDEQVKIRGFRIELGEIEAVLSAHPSVLETVVIAREDVPGDKRLAAYVVPAEPSAFDESALRLHVQELLPSYMLPSAFVALEALPLTANGKVDRRQLPRPEYAAHRDYVAPRDETEAQVAAIFAGVLGMEQVSVHDNFFELGGHSLLAAQAISRLNAAFGITMPLRSLFEAGNVEGVAARIASEQQTMQAPKIVPADRGAHSPLSFSQQRLWLIDQLLSGTAVYNIPHALRFRGKLDVTALEKALQEIVNRHEALRTTFTEVNGEPVQVIASTQTVFLEKVSSVQEDELMSLLEAQAARPFDLISGPLVRFLLVTLSSDEQVLMLNMHHIVSDGWSMGVLVREFAELYTAFSQEKQSDLPPLPVQYADYAVWQRNWLESDVLQPQLAYWQKQLGGELPLLQLPTDRPRPAVQSYEGAEVKQVLPHALQDQLQALSREHGTTLFMTLLAAFHTLLSRYSGQEDIVVGTPIAGRTQEAVEDLIGFFVNTLVLRADLSGAPSFSELLGRVKETALQAYAHQDVPFEKLVETLAPERDLSRSPLFQVMFILQNAPVSRLDLPGVTAAPLELHSQTAKFDLTLTFTEGDSGLTGAWEYNTRLFDRTTVERMAGHFTALLTALVQHPSLPVTAAPFLSTSEQEYLLTALNDTAAAYPQGLCIHQLFEAQAAKTPGATALIAGETRLSYRELDERANAVAHRLQALGVREESLVGVYMERSAEMAVGILGILKAGGAYVPLDPAYPQERVLYTMEDAQMSVLLTEDHLLADLPEHAATALCLPLDEAGRTDHPVSNVTDRHLAYVIYTSGSTGRPKGVAIEHHSAATMIHWAQREYEPADLAGVLFSTSICFDLSVYELFVTLAAGGTVILADNALHLPTLAARDEVTLINTVPSAIAELLRTAGIPASVRTVNLAGEALPLQLVQGIYALGTVEKVYNLYGPSEDTTYSTYALIDREAKAVTIGRPLANTQAYLLDAGLQLVAPGVPGQLYLAGDGLARGYLGQEELTAEKFVHNPFSTDPEARMYATGDLARWLPDGSLEYMGRIDQQVKVRGFRIELGEIESVLGQHPAVQSAVVMVREDVPGDKRITAYLAADATEVSVQELRALVKSHLPEFMLPSAFVVLDALPLTPNGKVDRKALPVPDLTASETEYLAPRSQTEEAIAAIFAEVLRREQVGALDDFFELGGHSLLATQAVSRINAQFGIEMPLRSFFEDSSVEALAARAQRLQQAEERPSAIPIPQADRGASLPLSFAQQRLWVLDKLLQNRAVYNMPLAVRLTGTLDTDAVEASLNAVIARHESLRTTFADQDGVPAQVITAQAPLVLAQTDLRHLPEGEREAVLLQLSDEEAERPFTLTEDLLLRALLVRLAEEDAVLLINMHHIISDGWSLGVLTKEFSAHYTAYVTGTQALLPELTIQYADYATWQQHWLESTAMDEQLSYWKKQLDGELPALQLPTDHPRPAMQSYRGATETFTLPQALTDRLQMLSGCEGTTLFMTLFAAFNTLLYRLSGQTDLLVGTPVAGRTRRELEGLIGFFVNTLVLRTDLSETPSFTDLLRRVKEVALEAYDHQDLPFEKLVEALQPERDLSRSPLFQAMFGLQNMPFQAAELPGVSLRQLELNSRTAKFDLNLLMFENENGLSGALEYSTDLFERATISRMIGHFITLLESIVEAPERSVAELPLLQAQELTDLLTAFGTGERAELTHTTVAAMAAEQAARTPDATALIFGSETLTYRELNERANRLARRLQTHGVGPDVLVGLSMRRSFDMIVALLGILKAGGAYVPLDPSYPAARLAFIMEEAAMPVLLTQQGVLTTPVPDQVTVIELDAAHDIWQSESSAEPSSSATPDHLLYVLYTSGSTGNPKGVAMPHRTGVNLLNWQLRTGKKADARTLQFTSLNFDVSFQEIFSTLTAGGTLVLIPEDVRQDLSQLPRILEAQRVERLFLPFIALQHLAEIAAEQRIFPAVLREVITAGEQLQITPALRAFFTQLPGCVLDNQYGPTESHVVTSHKLTGAPETWPLLPPIGRPVANSSLYILDPLLQPVPAGVAGELYIGGAVLARGYLKRADLTEERFVRHPFRAGERLYKTGDRARFLADGSIEYLGRTDFQVKIRGFRIELGEIEAVLNQHPQVGDAAVTSYQDERGSSRLAAYTSGGAEEADLRRFLKDHLPEYMIPTVFVPLNALPLTPSGKVDRRALPAPDLSAQTQTAYTAPRNRVEALIAAVFAEVLGLEKVGAFDHFFDLGGHSLLGAQAIIRINTKLGTDVSLRSLFETPTVAELARTVAQQPQGAATERPPLRTVSRFEPLPLSYAQQRLWVLDQLLPGTAVYNMPIVVRLQGALNETLLKRSLNEMIARHEVLRTTFAEQNGQTVQVIQDSVPLSMSSVDLTCLPHEQREAEARRLVQAAVEQGFDLTRGPLVNGTLYRLGDDDHVLVVNQHHIITDGWSCGVFVREFLALYTAFGSGAASPLPDLAVQYADYAVWQRTWLESGELDRQLGYWKQKLGGGLPTLQLPTDRPRPAVQTNNGALEKFVLDRTLAESLKQLSRRHDSTLYMTMLAAFNTLLFRYTGQEDLAVGTPVAGRSCEETENMIGFFVNTLVLRTDLSGSPSFTDLLRRVKETALEGFRHQDVPFEKLVEELQPERDLSQSPLFQVMFEMQNTPMPDVTEAELSFQPFEFDYKIAKFDLTLSISEQGDTIEGAWEYNTDLFDRDTIVRMAGHLQTLLQSITAQPDTSIALLPILTAAETSHLLDELNSKTAPYPHHLCAHQVFDQQAEQTPHAVAVEFQNEQLTYAELKRRANALALQLQAKGIRPGVFVGYFGERNLDWSVAVLAVFKAGGIYVPLDPKYPADRLGFMIEDTNPQVLLTFREYADTLPEHQAHVLLLDEELSAEGEGGDEFVSTVTPNDVAYVIFTSGSTGRPKGAQVEQKGMLNHLLAKVDELAVTAQDKIAQNSSQCVDISVWQLLTAWMVGAETHILPDEVAFDPARQLQEMEQSKLTVVETVPSLLRAMLDVVAEREPHIPDLSALRWMIPNGEVLPPELCRKWLHYYPQAYLINAYGPTECSDDVTHHFITEPPGPDVTNVPIGRVIPNMKLYVLDKAMQLVPLGVPGELHIGGIGVGPGYLNNPERTAQSFLDDFISGQEGARLYKTGDLVRYRANGLLEFLSRIDNQVKIRGFRIEIGEIETLLNKHAQIVECVVIAREDSPGIKRLVAYLVAAPGEEPDRSELRRYLKESLPEYMVPSAFVVLDALPLTANGKINRRALPVPNEPTVDDATYTAPRSPEETKVAAIMAEVLGMEKVGIFDNFFELGGHSLMATQVMSRIRSEFQVEMSFRELLKSPTVADIAKLLHAAEPKADSPQRPRIQGRSRDAHRRKR